MDTAAASTRTIHLRVWRQETGEQPGHFEDFKIPYHKGANVISCLMEVQRNPVTADGKRVAPPVWDSNCLEEVCGSCAMNINGRVRMACSALIDQLEQPVTLEPMHKFPVVRDLAVNRDRMFEALKKVHAWIEIDGTHNLGPGPRMSPELQADRYVLSTCITCGSCLEACPQVSVDNDFLGAAAISQARLFHLHPTGATQDEPRLRGLMGEGGIQDCGKAMNCVHVCPKAIPLTTSIASMNREATKQVLKDMFRQDLQHKDKPGGPA